MSQEEFRDAVRIALMGRSIPKYMTGMPVDSLMTRFEIIDEEPDEIWYCPYHQLDEKGKLTSDEGELYVNAQRVLMDVYLSPNKLITGQNILKLHRDIDRASIWLCETVTYWDESNQVQCIGRYVPFEDFWRIMYQFTREHTIDIILLDL